MDDVRGRVVVGYDGSGAAGVAVDWAAAEARRRGARLTVVYVVDLFGLLPGPVPARPDVFETAALQVTAKGVERARTAAAGLDVEGETHVARTSAMLVEASKGADLLVVGTRGHGEITGALLGSVAFAVTAHAPCPVVVVRGDPSLPGPDRAVVVGVDAWPGPEPVVRFAADAAAAASAPLLVVTAYRNRLVELDTPDDLWRLERGGERKLEELGRERAEAAADGARLEARDRCPDLEVHVEVEEGPPAGVLTRHCDGAGLLVVGDHGPHGFAGLRLGSVSHALVHSGPCPVAFVRLSPPNLPVQE